MDEPFLEASMQVDFVKEVIIKKIATMEKDLIKMVEQELTSKKLIEKIKIQIDREIAYAIQGAVETVIEAKIQKSVALNKKIAKIVEKVAEKI